MCIWAHTITTLLKKTPHNSVWRCAYSSLESVLQVLLLKDKNFPDHVNQHSWPLFSAQLPLLSSLTSLRLDPIPVSTNWQTNNKQKNPRTTLRFRYLHTWSYRYLHHSSGTLQVQQRVCFLLANSANSKTSKPNQIFWVSERFELVLTFLSAVVVLSHT